MYHMSVSCVVPPECLPAVAECGLVDEIGEGALHITRESHRRNKGRLPRSRPGYYIIIEPYNQSTPPAGHSPHRCLQRGWSDYFWRASCAICRWAAARAALSLAMLS